MDQTEVSTTSTSLDIDSSNLHPNGESQNKNLSRETRIHRDDSAFFENVFPDTDEGKILQGILLMYLIKQEPRMGWAKRSVCSDSKLLAHPIESVAAHMWALPTLITIISQLEQFQDEFPEFNFESAAKMSLFHDVPELITGDFTPDDGITPDEKHILERDAMDKILNCFPKNIQSDLNNIYHRYEARDSIESKVVKDCDKLDFILTAFVYERQGFSYMDEFYWKTINSEFYSKTIRKIANTLVETRIELVGKNLIYKKKKSDYS